MAYQQYDNTWLQLLPCELQDEISKIVTKEYLYEVHAELYAETTNDIAPSTVLVTMFPSKYERILNDIMEFLISAPINVDNSMLSDTMQTILEYFNIFIKKNYEHINVERHVISNRGYELSKFFNDTVYSIVISIIYSKTTCYDRIKTLKNALTVLTYQELLDFKNVIKQERYSGLTIMV
tara:strand:+ start:254 stop:793 length:540 start_codon:yes stop_codon:yes gene_type:complete